MSKDKAARLFGRVSGAIGDKIKQTQAAFLKKQILDDLAELRGMAPYADKLQTPFMKDLPPAKELAVLELDQLQKLVPEGLGEIVVQARKIVERERAAELEVTRKKEARAARISWADERLSELTKRSGKFEVSIDGHISRSEMRWAIANVTKQANASGGSIGGGSATGFLINIHRSTLCSSVHVVPEEYRRYLLAVLTFFKFDDDYTQSAAVHRLLAVMWLYGDAAEQLYSQYEADVMEMFMPRYLSQMKGKIGSELIEL